ncbi:cytosolic protein [Bacillus sp. SCS-153A]|uniref:cytosolic protein n=1 Tax=Rossellomorea sedimentorum TaxID=3115294 RepID=UPI00390581CB
MTIFKSDIETSDSTPEKELKTRYYKSAQDKVFQAVLDLFSSHEYRVVAESRERGEITVEQSGFPGYFIVVTAINVAPFESAVDFKISAEKKVPGTYSKMKQKITSYYQVLDTRLKRA